MPTVATGLVDFFFNSFEYWKGPYAWAVSDHQAKK